jgi:CMP-N-acetylneuraminic acid synthetase
MNGTSPPRDRARAAISAESVLTTQRVIDGTSSAARRLCPISGRPASGRVFLPGRPFEPPRAGMTARTRMGPILARMSAVGPLSTPGQPTQPALSAQPALSSVFALTERPGLYVVAEAGVNHDGSVADAHALAAVEEQEGSTYDFLVLLDPTSPAREPADIEAALSRLADRADWDGVVSVSAPTFQPVWVGVRPSPDDPDRMERYFPEGAGITRRQQLGRFLRVNGNFYVWRAAFVRRMQTSWMDEGAHGMVEIPESRAFAIDYQYEFDVLEAMLAQGLVTLPWLRPGA